MTWQNQKVLLTLWSSSHFIDEVVPRGAVKLGNFTQFDGFNAITKILSRQEILHSLEIAVVD